jgi:cation transport ATPase
MFRSNGRPLVDSLQLFSLSVAVLVAALALLLAVTAGVSLETAVMRAIVVLVVFGGLAFGAASLARWVLGTQKGA